MQCMGDSFWHCMASECSGEMNTVTAVANMLSCTVNVALQWQSKLRGMGTRDFILSIKASAHLSSVDLCCVLVVLQGCDDQTWPNR